MPAIVAFGRKWLVGSDDFVFPAMVDLTVKLCWLLGALVVFFRNDPHFGCPDGDHFKIYLYGLIAMLLMLVLTDALVVRNSICGSILDEEARVRVVPFIYIRCFFELLDIFWNILGTAWAYGDPFMMGCPEEPEALTFMKRFTVCNWISILIMFLFFVALWDPLGHYDAPTSTSDARKKDPLSDYLPPYPSAYHEPIHSSSSSLPHSKLAHYWTAKLKKLTCFCCHPSKDQTVLGAFEEAGRIISYTFKDSNYVTTDVLAGLLALYVRTQNEDAARREAIRKRNSISPDGPVTCICRANHNNANSVLYIQPQLAITTQPLKNTEESPEVLASKQDIVLLDHYLRFIHGCYGWKAFLVKNLKKRGIARLWSSMQFCACFRNQSGIEIKGDNCCLCSTAALRQTARVDSQDIVYISFENGYFEPPFYVAVDHSTKSLIVAIRGTLTTRDMLTNLTAWPSPMEIPGLPLHFKCHHGMLITARNVKTKLENDKVLDRLLQQYPEYRVVLLGQSSGGAVATILGMMLYYAYPSLQVFCYSPPGCVLNKDAAEFSKSFVLSVTYGDDIVARLGIQSISRFKTRLSQAIVACQTPKYRLMLGYGRLFRRNKGLPKFEYFEQVPEVIVVGVEEDNNNENGSSVGGREGSSVGTRPKKSGHYEHSPFYTPMFVPGRILHVTQRDSWLELPEAGPRWQLRWADKKEFQDIIISPRMFADHWYHRMEKGLHEFVIANCREAFNALHNSSSSNQMHHGNSSSNNPVNQLPPPSE